MKKRIISFLVAVAVVVTSLNLPIASSAATQADGNLLYGLTATANKEHYDGWYNLPDNRHISNLTDGATYVGTGYNQGKMFVSPYDANGKAYVNFSFDTAKTLNKIVVYFPGYNAVSVENQVRDYVVDVQLENGAWERVAEKHNEQRSYWDAFSDTLCFAPVTCTSLRITCVNTHEQSSIGFYEIEAYNDTSLTPNNYTVMDSRDYTADAIPLPETIDLMNTATISANEAYYNGWYPDNRPLSKLNDGQNYVGTGYNTAQTATIPMGINGTGYVNANFGSATTVNKVDIYFAGYNADTNACNIRDFAIDVKLQDETWIRVAEQHLEEWSAWDAKKVTLCFEAVKATDMRVTFKGSSSVFLYEIDAFNVINLTTANHTPINSGDFTEKFIPRPEFSDWVEDGKVPALNEYAYSFAVVGDTQIVAKNDAANGTTDLSDMYQYIIDKKDEYNISQVIGLGDIVDTYSDDAQWNVAINAIKKLDGVLPYTLVSGNHDVNWMFNYKIGNVGQLGYLNQSQIISKYGKTQAGQTTDESSAANTAHTFTVGGRDYLILTLEYAASSTPDVMEWANDMIAAHPYHNVIVTTHAYLAADGSILDGTQTGSPSSYAGCEEHNDGDYFWDNLISKHENIVMVLCGHVGTDNIVKTTRVGDKGNTVTQIMINPQDVDAAIGSTGMLAFMYFSEDGQTVQLRQYSTEREKYYGHGSQVTFTVPVVAPKQGVDPTNLLPGTNVTVNGSYYNGWYPYNRPISALTDGNTHFGVGFGLDKTMITPYESDGSAYVEFKFDEETTFNKMVLYFPGLRAVAIENQVRDYAIDVCSADGVWTRVAEQHNASVSKWDVYSETLCFEEITGTKIRITSVNAQGQASAGFYEIEAYYDELIDEDDYTPLEEGSATVPQPKSADWVNTAVPALGDYAYSFAVVGDTQIVTKNDAAKGTAYLSDMYQYIIDKKDEYKISQVIGLGDIVDTYSDATVQNAEWNVAIGAIKKLDGVLPYTLVSGNHDVNWNFNYRIGNVNQLGYLNQSQIISKYGKIQAGVETDEPSAANTAHAFTVGGRDYLILTLEYAASSTPGVMEWANDMVAAHPYHNVIVTTHAYLAADGSILDGSQDGSPSSYAGSSEHNDGDYFWDNLISKHENIVMVLCGHVGTDNIVKTTRVGEKGNTVTQIMINPQDLDAEIGSTGMLAFMYFSEDGKTVQVRQYSTVHEKYYGNESQITFTIPVIEALDNLLPGTKVTANNGYYNGWYPTNRPISALTDGKTYVGVGYNLGNTMITPYESDGSSYVEFEFEKETTFNKMVLYFPGTSAVKTADQVRDYAIDVCSADGVWTRVAEQHNKVVDKWDAYSDTLCFEKITGTKIRITSVNAQGQASAGYYEIAAYYDELIEKEDYTPLEKGDAKIPQPKSTQWVAEKELDDYAYSFAIVGDTQIVAKNDAANGTKDLKNLYKYILDKKDAYNIQQVIGVGDIIDTYDNEATMNKEWDVAAEAITQLDGKIPYVLAAGNHDLNWRYNYVVPGRFPNYLTQSQVIARYGRIDAGEKTDEPSVANTAHTFSVGDKDYLVLTLEYAAHHTPELMEWANGVVEAHPNHNVIINTHAYLAADGSILDGSQSGSPSSYTGCEEHNDGDYFWDNLVKKHENIVMVLCGHVGVDNVVVSTKEGEHGNKVTQIMTNAQDLDAEFGNMGMVTFLYFSEDGSKVQVRQYSTVHDRYYGKTSQLSGKDTLEIDVIERSGTNCLEKTDKVIANVAYYNGWYPDYRPLSSLTDGDKDFIFRGDKATAIPYGSNGTAYVQFEFETVKKFNQVKLYFPDAGADNNSMPMEDRITDFAIDVKLADGTWQRIVEQHVKAPTSWEKYNYVISFETVNCVAMRITSANHNGQKTLVFSEIEALYQGDMSKANYGVKTVVGNVVKEKSTVVNDCQDKTKLQIEKPMKNLLSGIIPTTNKADNSWYNEFRPLKNITDDLTDVYSAANIATIDYCGGQAYFDFKFKNKTEINRVDIYVADSQNNELKERPTDFAVDVQLADGSWKRVAEVHVETPKQEEFYMYKITFEKVVCKKVRVTSIDQNGQTYFAISEIQAFMDENVVEPYTGITKPSSSKYEIPMPKIRLKSTAKFDGLSTSPEGKKVK